MKIIALIPHVYKHYTSSAIVELTGPELETLFGKTTSGRTAKDVVPGDVVEINKRVHHASVILDQAKDVQSLPGVLRTLASTLELSYPAIDKVTTVDETGWDKQETGQ